MRLLFTFASVVLVAASPSAARNTSPIGPISPNRIEISSSTGTARLVVFNEKASVRKIDTSQADWALDFFSRHGKLFGINDPEKELQVVDIKTDRLDHQHTTLAQLHQGVPVLGGLLRIHQGPDEKILSVNGLFVPDLLINTSPKVPASAARDLALGLVSLEVPALDLPHLDAEEPKLMVVRTHLARGIPGNDHLAWEVVISDGQAIREILYIDANHGKVIDRVNGIHTIYRQIHTPTIDTTVWREGDEFPYSGSNAIDNDEVNELILSSQDIYTLFANLSGDDYLSWNGHDAQMHSVQGFVYDDCPNAFWNGQFTSFCQGMATDDIAAHEWTHAYTMTTHNLLYRYQPGALNEAYSDIFGEIADQLNGRGSDLPDGQRTDGACSSTDNSLRWLIGEDSNSGAFRDMWNPLCFGDPTRVSHLRYRCGEDDSGGVHSNSGIPNHAFSLATDGGLSNGQQVTGIGLTRSAHIWWRAMSIYQVPTTDFQAHADLIDLACADLIGANLTDLVTGEVSPDRINSSHCTEVAKAMTAVEMRMLPEQCEFEPLLAPSPPSFPGSQVLFSEDFSSDPFLGGSPWSVSNSGVYAEYEPRDWAWVNNPPEGSDGNGTAFAIDSLFIGDCVPGSDDQSGVMYLESPPIVIPDDSREIFLLLDHYVATEGQWDGGLIEVSVDGQAFQDVVVDAFRFNPYPSRLENLAGGNANPLAGRWAFHGSDGGSVRGSWSQSQVSLQGLANPGKTIVIRFAFGVDGCNGLDGWYLDRVQLIEDGPPPRQGSGRSGG